MFSAAQAEDKGEKSAERFNKAKQRATEMIDKRISALSETKSCIASASDKSSLKACKKAARAKHQEMRSERKERMKERKEKRKNRRKNKDN